MELIKFNNVHLKKLMEKGKIKKSKEYVQKFFYPSLDKIFYYDGIKFILYRKCDAINLISRDCYIEKKEANEETKKFETMKYSARDFLSESWFMEVQYIPDIDFSTDEQIYKIKKKIRKVEYQQHYLNMSKPMNYDKTDEMKNMKKAKEDIKMIYAHIFEVMASSNIELNNYLLNYIACTFGGRKLRTCLYMQSLERCGRGIIINDL